MVGSFRFGGSFRVCRDKRRLLSRQKYAFAKYAKVCDKTVFVATKIFATNVLSRQAYFCRDQRHVLSRQTRVCRDKQLSRQNMSRQKYFVAPNIILSRQAYFCSRIPKMCLVATKLLSRQKWYLWQLLPVIGEGRGACDR